MRVMLMYVEEKILNRKLYQFKEKELIKKELD